MRRIRPSVIIRIGVMGATILAVLFLSLAGQEWGGIARAQTIVPGTETTVTGTGDLDDQVVDNPLSVDDPDGDTIWTAQINLGPLPSVGSVPAINDDGDLTTIGSATAGLIDPGDLPPDPVAGPPLDQVLQINFFDPAGNPIVFIGRPVLVCFVPTVPAANQIRRFDPDLGRWVAFPTFPGTGANAGKVCTSTRVPGSFGMFAS